METRERHLAPKVTQDSKVPRRRFIEQWESCADKQSAGPPVRPKNEMEMPFAEEEQSEEMQEMRTMKTPRMPTAKEREEHELEGHIRYRSWCRHCVSAGAYGEKHATTEEVEDGEVPEIVMDFFYLGDDESKVMPNIVIKDRKSIAYGATTLQAKNSAHGVAYTAGFIKETGYRRVVLKSNESQLF